MNQSKFTISGQALATLLLLLFRATLIGMEEGALPRHFISTEEDTLLVCRNSIFLRLTVELAGKYALVGIYCLFRHVRWYVGDQ